MSWEEVQKLSKAGRLDEAWKRGHELLEQNPRDFKTRSQLEWVCYYRLKAAIATIREDLKAGGRADQQDLRTIDSALHDFSTLPDVQVPGMACSMILKVLSGVSAHFPKFGLFVRWVRDDGLRLEDWKPNSFQGKSYSSVASSVARGLAKWVRVHAADDTEWIDESIHWLRLARAHPGPDDEWTDWQLALMLRMRGDHEGAATALAAVLKAKRNEFWAWAEAGRLYASDQPELARACFCRALTCPATDGFKINVYVDLAVVLAELGDYPQASRETLTAIEIREREGWKIPQELQDLIDSPWYDPEAPGAEESKAFYARYAAEALVLCFDNVKTGPGTYLGTIIPKAENPPPGWKPRPLPRFAVRDEQGKSLSLVAPGMKIRNLEPGAPVTIVRGLQDDGRETIAQVVPRAAGTPWDCLDARGGILLGAARDGAPRVFIDRDNSSIKLPDSAAGSLKALAPGDPVILRVATNPKRGRLDVAMAEPGELVEHPDIQSFSGRMRRNPMGFAFVDDIFVSPPLVEALPAEAESVTGIAVYARKPKSEDYGWSAVTVRPE